MYKYYILKLNILNDFKKKFKKEGTYILMIYFFIHYFY